MQLWTSPLDVKFSPQLPGLWAPGSEKIVAISSTMESDHSFIHLRALLVDDYTVSSSLNLWIADLRTWNPAMGCIQTLTKIFHNYIPNLITALKAQFPTLSNDSPIFPLALVLWCIAGFALCSGGGCTITVTRAARGAPRDSAAARTLPIGLYRSACSISAICLSLLESYCVCVYFYIFLWFIIYRIQHCIFMYDTILSLRHITVVFDNPEKPPARPRDMDSAHPLPSLKKLELHYLQSSCHRFECSSIPLPIQRSPKRKLPGQ